MRIRKARLYMKLMCKNVPVYDIDKKEILNDALIPGSILHGMSFETWMTHRRSLLSNVMARKLYFSAFGYSADENADAQTHIFSLSDCYWRKSDGENISFEQASPYYEPFWNGGGKYSGGPVPSIYIGGAVSKYWIDKNTLFKLGCQIEFEIYTLLKNLGVECNSITLSDDGGGILVGNITDADTMLETAICSGRFKSTYFPTIDEIIEAFGDPGIKMLVIDAIIGNTDRHLENFGFMRNANTGDYLGMAPLYDFDHALESTGSDDYLIQNVPKSQIAVEICNSVINMPTSPIFQLRAREILKRV